MITVIVPFIWSLVKTAGIASELSASSASLPNIRKPMADTTKKAVGGEPDKTKTLKDEPEEAVHIISREEAIAACAKVKGDSNQICIFDGKSIINSWINSFENSACCKWIIYII